MTRLSPPHISHLTCSLYKVEWLQFFSQLTGEYRPMFGRLHQHTLQHIIQPSCMVMSRCILLETLWTILNRFTVLIR